SPASSESTEKRSPAAAMALSSENTAASAARSTSIVRSPPAPTASCARPSTVPEIGITTSRTRAPIRRKTSSQSAEVSALGLGRGRGGVHAAPAATPALDDDRDEIRLLHRPDPLDELRDRDAVRVLDAEHHEPLRELIVQLCPVVQVHLFQGFEDVV